MPKKSKLKEMARQLAAEKAKTKLLRKKLNKSRAENKLLMESFSNQTITEGSSTGGSVTFESDERNRLSSTRKNVETVQDIVLEELQGNRDDSVQDATDPGDASQKESQCLSTDDESRINLARGTVKDGQMTSRSNFAQNLTSQEESKFLVSMNQLSMASINVPECKPGDDGEIHRQTYELWKELLLDSMSLAGLVDEQTKFTFFFKVKAGIKLLQIFRNTKSQSGDPDPQTKPFSNAMHRLKSYFGSGSDVMLMRRKMALMGQRADETD